MRKRAFLSLRNRVILVLVVVGLLGGFVATRAALPGDLLYGVKRSGENWWASQTDDQVQRARRYLSLATQRVTELEALAQANRTIPVDLATDLGAHYQAAFENLDLYNPSVDSDVRAVYEETVSRNQQQINAVLNSATPGPMFAIVQLVADVNASAALPSLPGVTPNP